MSSGSVAVALAIVVEAAVRLEWVGLNGSVVRDASGSPNGVSFSEVNRGSATADD
jgi:hypothetical protein